MPVFWAVDFETGDLSHVATEITSPATIEVNSKKPHKGVFSAEINSSVGGASGRGRIEAPYHPIKTTVYMQAAFCLDVWGNWYIEVMRFYRSGVGYVARVTIRPGSITLLLGDKAYGYYWSKSQPFTFRTGAFYIIEVGMHMSDAVDGWARVWVNGQEMSDLAYYGVTQEDPAFDGINRFIVGIVLLQVGAPSTRLYVDDYIVSDEPIGYIPLVYSLFVDSNIIVPFTIQKI